MDIPLIYLKDKQAFTKQDGPMRLLGKPQDVAKSLHEGGCMLIHFVDMNALAGASTNFDVYDGLTYFINVEVECAPRAELVHKLLSIKCRVVLPPADSKGGMDVTEMREKKLLVAKIPPGYKGEAAGFHDVILEEADKAGVERFASLGKRVIIYDKDKGKAKGRVWGVITPSS